MDPLQILVAYFRHTLRLSCIFKYKQKNHTLKLPVWSSSKLESYAPWRFIIIRSEHRRTPKHLSSHCKVAIWKKELLATTTEQCLLPYPSAYWQSFILCFIVWGKLWKCFDPIFLFSPPTGLNMSESNNLSNPPHGTNSSSVAIAILVPFFALIFAGFGFYLYKQR